MIFLRLLKIHLHICQDNRFGIIEKEMQVRVLQLYPRQFHYPCIKFYFFLFSIPSVFNSHRLFRITLNHMQRYFNAVQYMYLSIYSSMTLNSCPVRSSLLIVTTCYSPHIQKSQAPSPLRFQQTLNHENSRESTANCPASHPPYS